ncbi:MAG: TOBE domain-containing protein [Candidatus Dormibacteraeota bacterium]|nr:TOBE domain-containing protein [Candidatus Dormibacteraeota bacterium]
MATYKVGDAAALLGVSPDTVRRWVDSGRLGSRQVSGRRLIDGQELARFAETLATSPTVGAVASESTRNRFSGIVTRVVRDKVMAQVEVQAGPHRVVALISRDAADELKLAPGTRVVAAVKATNVTVELPGPQ